MQKQPFKVIEVPLSKFNDEAIPYHQMVFEKHKTCMQKLIATRKIDQLKKEMRDHKRSVQQLKDLTYELDTLRAQVQDDDLDKFDDRTFASRKIITALTKDYRYLQKQAEQLVQSQNQINENIENGIADENTFETAAKSLQVLQCSVNELKLQETKERLDSVEALESDLQVLQEMYVDLNGMVTEQRETVTHVEEDVVVVQDNVNEGLKHIIKASKLKTAAYPVTGALVGTLVGGPVGFVAGFKIGGLAALSCGVAGYVGGKFFNKCNENEIAKTENHINAQIDAESAAVSAPVNEAGDSDVKKDN